MDFRRHMVPVSEFARRKGLDELQLIYMIRDGGYGYKGYADENGFWYVDDRSPLHYRSPAVAFSFSLLNCLLSCLAVVVLTAGMLAWYVFAYRRGEMTAGMGLLLSGMVCAAVLAVMARGLEVLRKIERNTRNFRLRIEQNSQNSN